MTYILISPKQILSEPASLATQNTMADFIWIVMGLKLYQTLLHFGSPQRAAAGTGHLQIKRFNLIHESKLPTRLSCYST